MSAAPLLLVGCLVPQSEVHERIELHLPHPAPYDWMGEAVALEGTRVLVGVPYDDSAQGNNSGSARLFERLPDGSWNQVANLRADDRARNEYFGGAVSLAGDRALVGADQDDGFLGAAYVFERNTSGTWSQAAKLVPSVRGSSYFGHEVALSGERALVGSHLDNDAGDDAGAAHLFERRPNGTWKEVAKLVASDAAPLDNFGIAVAIAGERVLIGAWGKRAAYVFERDATGSWRETAKLLSGDRGAVQFGQSVALSGERALIGDQTQGAAYVFERDSLGAWTRSAKLQGSVNAFFGYDVALSGERALVGAHWGPSARLFEHKPNGEWVERLELVHEQQGTDWFGWSVALSGDWIAVGAPRDGDLGVGTGSTTVFKLSSPATHPNPSLPGLYSPPVSVPLLTQTWIPFDPIRRSPGLSNGWVPLYYRP